MNYFVDTHAHIYAEEFRSDFDGMMYRATEAGIGKIFMPNVDSASIEPMLEVEQRFPETCFAMMGLHPCSVKGDFEKELRMVEEWLGKRKFSAVGEMGTDLYWDKTYWDQQKEAFIVQVNWAKNYNLPIVIHSRESTNETIELLKPLVDNKLRGIFHCFSGTASQARQIVEMGFLLGIGGVATFKNGGLDKVLPDLTLDQIVLETDSPYLAPVPYRGKRNEPSYIPLIAERISSVIGHPVNEIMERTTHNALKLFGQEHGAGFSAKS